MFSPSDFWLIILAFFLPPVAVYIKRRTGRDLAINILLFLCTLLPSPLLPSIPPFPAYL